VIGYVHIEKHHRVSCDVKKLATRLSRAKLQIREFKFHEDREDVRRRLLNLIAKSEVKCGYVTINKTAVAARLMDKPDILYNYLAVNYPIKHIIHSHRPDKIEYVIDKQVWSRRRRESFNQYVIDKSSWVSIVECNDFPPEILLKHDVSQNDPCLQIADYVAASVFQFYERKKPEYYNIISKKFPYGWRDIWGLGV
jgi:hypothetical protein